MIKLTRSSQVADQAEDEVEGAVLERNIMEGPEGRLCRPENMESDLWTEVVRLNSYLGRGHIHTEMCTLIISGFTNC